MRCTAQQHRHQFMGKPNAARGCQIVCPESSREDRGAGNGAVEERRGLRAWEGGRWGEGTGGTRRTSSTHSHFCSALGFGIGPQPRLFWKPENWKAMDSDPTIPEEGKMNPTPPIEKGVREISGK
ncbi:hypothetical protein PAL_GLEAN10014774 [Pteropus alecto]|uniref:Uncharacterized protein n=1 Tax=Pteropus alecto TaxID=9402 RepID=L5KNG5_PTEAL|nr:hypothetical protein PAL_GLEAN10014774 [Pteropus alecto]